MRVLAIVTIFCLFSVAIATTSRSDALISSLPDLDFEPNFDQYSGYVTLEGTSKNIFYWFVESTNDPENDPVVLWLQGGPGCSGLGDGLLLEHGPYYPTVLDYNTNEVGLTSNPYSWNTVANIIYLESPCGVGFSYGDTPSSYTSDDNTTAYDSYLFLNGFFDIYTEFADNDFWISGESYGGVYVPTLAYQILNNGTNQQLIDNLNRGGLTLGNPVTNCDSATFSGPSDVLVLSDQVYMYYWHGMTSRSNYDAWNNAGCNSENPTSVATCYELYTTIENGVGVLDQPLNLFTEDHVISQLRDLSRKEREARSVETAFPPGAIDPDMLYFSFCTGNGTLDFATDSNPTCFPLSDQTTAYLNRADVQQAIHAQPTNWEECGGVIYTKTAGPIPNYLNNFFQVAPSMRILYYSGDVDLATVPFAGTQRCLATLNRPIVKEWQPYLFNDRDVGGYIEHYDKYSYATVKGAGHEGPQYQPAINYILWTSFIANEDLDY